MRPAFHAGLLALAVAACTSQPRLGGVPEDEIWGEPGGEVPRSARVVEVRAQDVPRSLTLGAKVAFDEARVAHVFSPVSGRIMRVMAEPGQRVQKGGPLATLLSPDAAAAFADAIKAEADLVMVRAELGRQRRIARVGAGSQRELEAAEDASGKAEAELARARLRAGLLRTGSIDAVTQEFVIRSPMAGRVMARSLNPGMEVAGTYAGGQPVELFTIGDIGTVWILGDVPEDELRRVHTGQRATVRVPAWPGRTFEGNVAWVSSSLDPALRTGRVRVALPNTDGALKPEMFAQMAIELPSANVLAVPRRAILTIEGQAFLYVAAGNAPNGGTRFQRRRVRLAEASDDLAVVEEGLTEDDQVLVEESPSHEIAPDVVRVTAQQAEQVNLRTVTIGDQDVGAALAASARLTFDDMRVAHVFSPVSGRVARVLAQPGQRVRKGTALLTLVSPDVGGALADAAKAAADAVAAEHERRRQQDLFEAHAGSRRDLEVAEDAWRKARAESDRAGQKARLLSAGTFDGVHQEYTVRSPIDGEVVARSASVGLEVQGQWGGGGGGPPVEVFTIGALDGLWVLGEVYEMDIPHVRPGAAVSVVIPAWPGKVFPGKVRWVSEMLDPATRTARVRCDVEDPERLLRPEMAPVLTIALRQTRQLAVPRSALLRLGDETVVFVAEPSQGEALGFRKRRIVAGNGEANVPVISGLVRGERVVVSGAIFLAGLL